MAVGHLRARKIILLAVLLVLAGGVVAASILTELETLSTIGISLIALTLFFNLSRRIYPARRIIKESRERPPEENEDAPAE